MRPYGHTKSVLMALLMMALSGSVMAAPALPASGGNEAAVAGELRPAVENTAAPTELPASQTQFSLKALHIDAGNLEVEQAALDKIVQEYVNRTISLTDLNEASARVTDYCRHHGYPAAAAYIPAQETDQASLVMKILPGRYGKIILDNQSRVDSDIPAGYLKGLQAGDIITDKSLETALYNVAALGGIQAAGVLSPGAEAGTSDLTVQVRDGKASRTIVYAENYGSESAGRYRYGVQTSFANMGGRGEQLSLGGMVSNKDLRNYSISYEIPAGRSGTKVGASFSHMNYELGNPYRVLGAQGKADTYSLFGNTPLYKTADKGLSLLYGYDYRRLKDDLETLNYSSRKHSHSIHAGLSGYERRGKGDFTYDVTGYWGTVGMDSDYAELLNQYNHTEGTYAKGVLNFQYVQRFNNYWDIYIKLEGQRASRNLDSSEEIYLGGANAVRAYPQGEGSGDEGYTGTVELRYHTSVPGLTLSTYFDSGHVNISKDGSNGGETLKGWGLGITYSKKDDWFARFDYARRIGQDEKASADAQSRGRMWFLLGKVW